MVHVENTEVNGLKVYSIGDEIVFIVGWENPNNANGGYGTDADRGAVFIEKTCNKTTGAFWTKGDANNPKSWVAIGATDEIGSVVIAPAATETVDSVLLAQYNTIKWMVNVDDSISKSESFTMFGRVRGTDAKYTRYGIIGDKNLQFTTTFSSDGTTILYQITNNEANPITVKYKREAI